jgi:mRNA-degrading endonuclease RelE of RelBE toxin-antitoxin system
VRIKIEPAFLKAIRSLPPNRRERANDALIKFQEAPDRPGLDFRPLKNGAGYFIIDSAHGDRIILRKDEPDLFAAVDVGPHDNVYRRWARRR